MSRTDDGADVVSYLLRNIDGEHWRKARVRAIIDDRDMSELLRSFIRDYGSGRLTPTKERKERKKK